MKSKCFKIHYDLIIFGLSPMIIATRKKTRQKKEFKKIVAVNGYFGNRVWMFRRNAIWVPKNVRCSDVNHTFKAICTPFCSCVGTSTVKN